VEIDGQGRLLLPQLLRDAAQLKGDVAVVGYQKYLEVRNLEAYRKQVLEDKITPEDAETLDELGI
jgi:MraZ protein